MEQVYYGVAIVFYGIFIIRFILSWVGGDFDLDMDADLDISDLATFKGATHFMMGLSGWLSVKSYVSYVQWYDYLIGIVLGVFFFIILYYVYKLMGSLESKLNILTGKDMIGFTGTVYIYKYYDMDNQKHHYIVTVNNGNGTTEVSGISDKKFKVGDKVILSDYKGTYYTLI